MKRVRLVWETFLIKWIYSRNPSRRCTLLILGLFTGLLWFWSVFFANKLRETFLISNISFTIVTKFAPRQLLALVRNLLCFQRQTVKYRRSPCVRLCDGLCLLILMSLPGIHRAKVRTELWARGLTFTAGLPSAGYTLGTVCAVSQLIFIINTIRHF